MYNPALRLRCFVTVLAFAGSVSMDSFSCASPAWGATSNADADFYVSPAGNNGWSGRLPEPNADCSDGPFATLSRARDAVRSLTGRENRDVTVLIRGGIYRLQETIVFSLQDSAPPQRTITYAAYPNERPVFSSAQSISGWRRPDVLPPELPAAARDQVWVADVSGRAPFYTLYDGDRQLPRARGPGFSPQNTTPRGSQDYQTVEFPPGAVRLGSDPQGVELRIVPSHFWIMNLLPIAAVDQQTRTLKTAQPGTYPLGRNGMTDRANAWIENALCVLDQPGQWVLDTANSLLYLWPVDGQPGPQLAAAALTELIRVEGRIDYDGPQDTPVQGLVFRGLTFTQGDRYPWHGRTGWGLQHDWECFDRPTALLRFRGAQGCAVEDCEFQQSGHSGIRLDLHCQRIRIVGNHLHHLGGVGVLLAGYGPGTKDVNRENEVVNNYIHHIGQQYWGSGGIFAWQSGHNRIAHNHIAHVPYTAILATGRISRTDPGPGECSRTIRWHELPESFRQGTWQQREPYLHARENVIEYNEIHNAMEVLGDGNCIYISGAGGDNLVRYNYCHDCTGRYMNAVIRCDDDQHGTTIHGNICCRTGGYGEGVISKGDNDITNNIVADLRPVDRHRGYIVFPYGSITGSTIQRNILYSCRPEQILYHHSVPSGRHGAPPTLDDTQTDHNVYWCTADDQWASKHLQAQHKQGNETHSVQADPLFVDVSADDFRFQAGSPAPALGIQPLDAALAGLQAPYRQRHIGQRIRTKIEPADQTFRPDLVVTIVCDHPSAVIRYTLDGTEPCDQSPPYTGPFRLDRAATVRARAYAPEATDLVGAVGNFAPPPPPILEDFESTPVGGRTTGATTAEDAQQTQYTARVTDQQAAGGERSLKFVDGPGQQHGYTPHVYYECRFREGRMVGAFDLCVDEAMSFSYQWRHYEDGYRQGPSVSVLPGGIVSHNGRELLKIPTGQWVRFEVGCMLGEQPTGQFRLRVGLPGEPAPRTFPALSHDADFQRLDWVGFVAKADRKATCFVDNIQVQPGE
jgi:hypothetical protein